MAIYLGSAFPQSSSNLPVLQHSSRGRIPRTYTVLHQTGFFPHPRHRGCPWALTPHFSPLPPACAGGGIRLCDTVPRFPLFPDSSGSALPTVYFLFTQGCSDFPRRLRLRVSAATIRSLPLQREILSKDKFIIQQVIVSVNFTS